MFWGTASTPPPVFRPFAPRRPIRVTACRERVGGWGWRAHLVLSWPSVAFPLASDGSRGIPIAEIRPRQREAKGRGKACVAALPPPASLSGTPFGALRGFRGRFRRPLALSWRLRCGVALPGGAPPLPACPVGVALGAGRRQHLLGVLPVP